MKKIFALLTLIFLGFSSYASHIPGGNITYQCTGNPNEYIVTMVMFVSCPSTLGSSYTLQTSNDCGLATQSVTLNQVGTEQEVSQICNAQQSQSDCPPGTGGIPGVLMYTYQATVTLAGPCDSWTFYFELCCRDASSNLTGTSGNSLYIETTMNSQTAPCDGSPYVTAQPIPYVCAGQNISYCPGAIDPDGDSLYYQLIAPYGAGATPIGHLAGYSIAQPLQNLTLDPVTGCIDFNQTVTGNYVIAYLIEAYDANGNLTGSIVHDFQFEVITCTNVTPDPPAGGIVLTSGNANQTGPNTIELCEGSSACFSMTFTDPDPADILTIDTTNSNIFAVFPGAIINVTGTNPMTVDVCWTVPAGSPSQISATVTVTDGACPIEGTATQVALFDVVTSTVAWPNQTICGNQQAQLNASGGTVFNWVAVSGPAINVGTNFSCNPCTNPIATPTATTTYEVTSNLSGGCDNIDSVTVTVVPDFTFTISQSSQSACLLDPIQLTTTVNPGGSGYSYLWTPNSFLDSDTIPNPVANISAPGSYTFYLDVTSPQGCVKSDSISVTIVPFVAPDITILTPDSLMPCGDSIQIDLDLGGGIPAICGPSPTNTCSGPITQTDIGTGATSLSNPPSPYYGFYEDGRVQMLYTAAELNAMGFMGGKITEISFNVINQASTQPYSGLTIKIGPTALNDFTGAIDFVPGLTQVYTNAGYNTVLGWNTHILNTAYEWDGVSNLIIEVCFDNTSWTSSDDVMQTATTVPRVLYAYEDGAVGCTLDGTSWSFASSFNRANIRFTHCPTTPDPNALDFLWTPNQTIITSTSQNPIVFPSNPTQYVVTVSDTGGNCFDTDTINIDVLCGTCYPPIPTWTNVTCKDGSDGEIIIDPVFVFGSEVQNFTWTDSITGAVLQTTNNVVAGMQDTLSGIPAGTYIITMTDSSGCSADTTVTITEPDSVLISNITPNDIICIGGSKQIDATATGGNGNPFTYHWTDVVSGNPIPGNGPHTVFPTSDPHCYEVYAEDVMGCFSDTQQVCIVLRPEITASSTDTAITICPSSSLANTSTNIDISAIGGSGSGYNYNWYENGVLIGSGGVINVTPTSTPTTYIGVATDNCTTPADTVAIYVDWFTPVDVNFMKNRPDSCYPITVELQDASITVDSISNYSWAISDGGILNGDTVPYTFTSPVCYDVTLTVTDTNGCVYTKDSSNFVCPHPYPDANFYMTPPITNILNTEIDFTNLSTGDGLSYLWNFGSGLVPDSSSAQHPTFIYPDDSSGTYNVLLTVTNQYGCVDTISGTVFINSVYLFYIPNSFTPDGDGKNEYFRPEGEGIDLSLYTMQIFDRWGELLYEAPANARGWDGTYKGKAVQVDTYVWRIVAKELDTPIIHENYGHVNLIR